MARPLRLESEDGVYHVLNRGNYRAAIFRTEKTRAAFLGCLAEACEKTGWVVHAWCVMANHYHLALSTPRGNLVEGMSWLQGTFANRFNRFRGEHGHLFQGRYKSFVVEPGERLGALCHYIHLNPVKAGLCPAGDLPSWRWTDMRWLVTPGTRPKWYDPSPALEHAGSLADTTAGRRKYLDYLSWLAEDEPARKQLGFERMTTGWIIGTAGFVKDLVKEHKMLASRGGHAAELRAAREAEWQEMLDRLRTKLGRQADEIPASGKSASWKLALAAALKAKTTATNRWLAAALHLGNLYEVSRKVAQWSRKPNPQLARAVGFTPNPKA